VDAVFSGQAATLALLEGAEAHVHRVSNFDTTISREGVSYLFEGCNDVVFLRGAQAESAQKQFEASWEADRSLRLMLISIDPEEDVELRCDAADCLEELLQDVRSQTFIENEFYSRSLPTDADTTLLSANEKWPNARKMLEGIIRQQSAIAERREAWDRLEPELFEKLKKSDFEERAIRRGGFRILASADLRGIDRNVAILCHKALASLPNARAVVSEWTKEFKRQGSKRVILPEDNDEYTIAAQQPGVDPRGAFSAYTNVIQQQKAIIEKIRTGSTRLAQRYADELVQSQLKWNGPQFAAQSLCNLAQEAKYFGLFSLQLEWAQRAVDVCPDDPWAHGQAADALLEYSRLDEALAEIDLCEANGDAEPGRARPRSALSLLQVTVATLRSNL
jgi:hypothetical protein